MKYGLQDEDLEYIITAIARFPEIRQAVIFGSRAKGNYKPGSDVDIAVIGENVSLHAIASLHSLLEEEGPLPYLFDIVDYTHTDHGELKEHIDRQGKIIFERPE